MKSSAIANQFAQALADQSQYERTETLVDTLYAVKWVLTYKPASEAAGYGQDHQRDPNFHRHLGETMKRDDGLKRPLRCSLVINKELGMPGEAYFDMARSLGYAIPNNKSDERKFWEGQITLLGLDPKTLTL